MRRPSLLHVAGVALAAAPAVLLVVLHEVEVHLTATIHFYSVGFSALVAAAAAVGLTVLGSRRGDTRTIVVGTAFAMMAALLALHGFATPGFVFGMNGVIAITGGVTLPAGGAILALSALPLPRTVRDPRPLHLLQALAVSIVVALGASALLWPSLLPTVPRPESPEAIALLVVGLGIFGLLTWRAYRTFLLTRRGIDMTVVVGLVWLGTALVPALLSNWEYLDWWIGHELELDGILAVGIAVAMDLARAAQSRPLSGDLSATELVAAEDLFLGSHVRALTVTLADKDEYTERHTRRVALRAVQVGEELGFSRSRLRSLAIGGLVHDIGKLSIPDAILKKPGPLDDDEYAMVKEHAERGYKLLTELGGFSDLVRDLVRDHHERLDGRGYPRGLAGGEISVDARILAVCDVYDALISKRVYRDAWTEDEALAFLREQAGTGFDAACVDALARVVERERPQLPLRDRVLVPQPAL
ncbi:MAG TPA: HD-GYP domain-containing protein [Gaiellaceae bacterium]